MKKAYLICFEIQSDASRIPFKNALMQYGLYCPINASCWAIMTDQSAVQIRENLSTVLGPQDRLFVIRSGTEAAWKNSYGPGYDDWLKKNL